MEYTIKKLSEIAGVSARTLRYYDEINLLKPCRINSSGYRIYSENEVDILQQILFYRSLDMKLDEIKEVISKPDFDINKALVEHYNNLISRRNQLDKLILTVEKTLAYRQGEISMSNLDKFEGFKKAKLEENEAKYGKEIREKYGEEEVKFTNEKWLNMSEDDFKEMNKAENNMIKELKEVIETQDLNSEAARNVFENHKAWLKFSWKSYSKEAHAGLAKMYVSDKRFAKYYNDKAESDKGVETLYNIIIKYAK